MLFLTAVFGRKNIRGESTENGLPHIHGMWNPVTPPPRAGVKSACPLRVTVLSDLCQQCNRTRCVLPMPRREMMVPGDIHVWVCVSLMKTRWDS